MTKNIILMEIETNPNIGLFMFANDKFVLAGKNFNSSQIEEIKKTLNVPVHQISILGTDLIGVFIAGNNEKIIIPNIYSYELEELKEIMKQYDIEIIEIEDKINTFGNSITLTKDSVLIGSEINKNLKEKIEKETKLKTFQIKNEQYTGAGSIFLYANSKLFGSQELQEDEVKEIISEISGVGSINAGSPFIASGAIGNKFGIILGSTSSTIEIQNLVEALDYI